MELELKMQEITCCEKTQCITISHEEVIETGIPEYCPDIARVVDTVGQLKVREKKLSNGHLSIGGVIKVTVLYTSEASSGLRSLVIPVQFACASDDPRLQGCRSICACGRLRLLEARAVTARKLYIRAMAEFEVEGIRGAKHCYCASAGEDPALHLHYHETESQLLTDVLERSFVVNQECALQAGKGRPEDLLMERVHLYSVGCQRIGNKLMIRGEATVSILYRTEEQELHSCDEVLQFSQIIDHVQLPENAVYQTEIWAEDSEVRLIRSDNGVGVGITIRVGAMVKVYEKVMLQYIDDMYSTKHDMTLQHESHQIAMLQPTQSWRQDAVQQLEFGQGRAFACVTGLECGSVHFAPEGEQTALRTNVRVKLLYLDEAGTPVSTERTMEVSVKLPQLPDHAWADCAPLVMNHGSNSCELRIPVDFFTEHTEILQMNTLTASEVRETEPGEEAAIVLRRIGEGDCLWNVAKAYRTDPHLIEKANGLEPGAPLPCGMLLIPR